MRIYQPLKIASGPNAGKWRMTVSSDEEGWCHATGYCGDDCAHDTPQEAENHFDEYVIDNATFTDTAQHEAEEQHRCEAPSCNNWSWNRGTARRHWTHTFWLCPSHLNRDGFKAALKNRKETRQ